MIRKIDNRNELVEMIQSLPKQLRQAIIDGSAPEQIYKDNLPIAAARIVAIAATERNPSVALAAAKDILDRVQGKAVERKLVKHQLEDVPDDQLDAILISELEGVE